MKFTIFLFIPLLAFSVEWTFPEDSQEFSHWSMPILAGEGSFRIADYTQDLLFPNLKPHQKYINSWMVSMAMSYLSYNLLFKSHYETEREQLLAVNGMGVLFAGHLVELAIRLPLWAKREKMAYLEKISAERQ